VSGEVVVLLLALGIEVIIGDPVARWHPVALFGRGVEMLMRWAPTQGRMRCIAYGGFVTVAGVCGAAGLGAFVLTALQTLNPVAALVGGAVLLKASFSYRQLEDEALRVAAELEHDRLVGARSSLRALVSRDTSELSPGLAVSAAVESLAENLSDSFVAPLLFYVLLGVPGALAYRAINTLDAMIGYHGRYEYLGRIAARLDDLANLVPARLTALLLVAGAGLARLDWRGALSTALRDHARTESPNAGWPMAAMAGATGVQLEKVGHYRLGDAVVERTPLVIRQAVRALRCAALLAVALALVGVAL
jgi:adenosylcobinamide-phosphate synthase